MCCLPEAGRGGPGPGLSAMRSGKGVGAEQQGHTDSSQGSGAGLGLRTYVRTAACQPSTEATGPPAAHLTCSLARPV